jgi:acyl-CoA thioesterase
MTRRFIQHVGLWIESAADGKSRLTLNLEPHHMNGLGIVHGGVLFTLADTGMGAALYPQLGEGNACATVEIKINYFKPVSAGALVCTSELVHKGRTLANVDSWVHAGDVLLAKANGTFAIFEKR